MYRQIRIAILATSDIGKPPIRSFALKKWLERFSSPVKDYVEIKVFVPNSEENLKELEKEILYFEPNLFFFYAHTCWPIKILSPLIRMVKNIETNPVLVVGIDAVSAFSREEAAKYGINFVLMGEYELNFEKISLMLVKGEKIDSGTSVLKDFGTLQNPDDVPSPFENSGLLPSNKTSILILPERGCKFHCGYCLIGKNSQRFSSQKRVKSDILRALELGNFLNRILVQATDIFDRNTQYILPFCRKIAEERHIFFIFNTNVGVYHSEEELAMADCQYFILVAGVQSLNSASLKSVNRFSDTDKIMNNIHRLRKYASKAALSLEFIFGLPYETERTWLAAMEWVLASRYDVSVNRLYIPPETELAFSSEGKQYKTCGTFPYYALSSNVLTEREFGELFRRTNKIFAVISMISRYEKIKYLFYSLVRKKQAKYPLISLAETIANKLTEDENCSRAFKDHIANCIDSSIELHSSQSNFFNSTDISILLKIMMKIAGRIEKSGE